MPNCTGRAALRAVSIAALADTKWRHAIGLVGDRAETVRGFFDRSDDVGRESREGSPHRQRELASRNNTTQQTQRKGTKLGRRASLLACAGPWTCGRMGCAAVGSRQARHGAHPAFTPGSRGPCAQQLKQASAIPLDGGVVIK